MVAVVSVLAAAPAARAEPEHGYDAQLATPELIPCAHAERVEHALVPVVGASEYGYDTAADLARASAFPVVGFLGVLVCFGPT